MLGQGTKDSGEGTDQAVQCGEGLGAVAWAPAASKVSATKQAGDEAQNKPAMAWRLARQLLCLHRVDTTNRAAYESSLGDEAIWTNFEASVHTQEARQIRELDS